MSRLNIVLVRPDYHSHLITPPLGLGYLSSYLKSKGYTTRIIDGLNSGYSVKKIVEECQGADLVGINCLSAYFTEVIKLSRELKKKGLITVIGGPQASALPVLTLAETQADYVVVGEGEMALGQLIEGLEHNKLQSNLLDHIPGIVSRASSPMARGRLIENLDLLPYPDWDQMPPRLYKKAPHGGVVKSFPVAPVISTRGCPFECTFCASPFLWDRVIRFRSPDNVVGEIEYLVKKFKVREIHFEDDNLTLKRGHIEGICKLILKRKIVVNWATPNGIRVDTLDLELLKLMKKSGCYFVAFGIESGNQKILDQARKKIDLGSIEKAVHRARKSGLITQGFFIFGLPGETKQTINESISLAKKLPLDKAQFLLLDILPGSELWAKLKRGQAMDWNYQSFQEAVWTPEGLSREELTRSLGYAFRSFFFRPRQIIFLWRYLKLSQLPFIIRRIIDFNIFPFLRVKHR